MIRAQLSNPLADVQLIFQLWTNNGFVRLGGQCNRKVDCMRWLHVHLCRIVSVLWTDKRFHEQLIWFYLSGVLRLDCPVLESRQGQGVLHHIVQTGSGVKRHGGVVNHCPPPSAEGKNWWIFASASPVCLHGADRENIIFCAQWKAVVAVWVCTPSTYSQSVFLRYGRQMLVFEALWELCLCYFVIHILPCTPVVSTSTANKAHIMGVMLVEYPILAWY